MRAPTDAEKTIIHSQSRQSLWRRAATAPIRKVVPASSRLVPTASHL
jgi:hypothetical protein